MANRPEPPPWGTLISDALQRTRISAREAARRAGISEGRWRQIAGGYQVVSSGIYAPVRGPADTLARMAAVVGVTPAELAASGRPDAATALTAAPEESAAGNEILQRVREMDPDQARELLAAIAVQLGIKLPGGRAGDRAEDHTGRRAGERERRYGT